MRRLRTMAWATSLALASVLGATTVAAAGSPQQVGITSLMPLDSPGTFDATGDAVDSGLICASGTVTDIEASFTGYQSARVAHNTVLKLFECEDGSGTITIQLQNHPDIQNPSEWFTWVVLGGTEAYSGLHGSGFGWTDPRQSNFEEGPWFNIYNGFLVG
jgi:hypothetical protein